MTDFNQKTHDTDVGSYGGQSRQMTEVFENQEFGSIRVLQEAGKTFFCASDVAKALGYFKKLLLCSSDRRLYPSVARCAIFSATRLMSVDMAQAICSAV